MQFSTKIIIILFFSFLIIHIVNSNTNNAQEKLTPLLKAKFTVYYTEWCGYSQMFLKEWNQNLLPAIDLSKNKNIKDNVIFEKIDCDKQKCININGYPTIILHKLDNSKVTYDGSRDTNSILAFIRKELAV